jgi:hypothetical protein
MLSSMLFADSFGCELFASEMFTGDIFAREMSSAGLGRFDLMKLASAQGYFAIPWHPRHPLTGEGFA